MKQSDIQKLVNFGYALSLKNDKKIELKVNNLDLKDERTEYILKGYKLGLLELKKDRLKQLDKGKGDKEISRDR